MIILVDISSIDFVRWRFRERSGIWMRQTLVRACFLSKCFVTMNSTVTVHVHRLRGWMDGRIGMRAMGVVHIRVHVV